MFVPKGCLSNNLPGLLQTTAKTGKAATASREHMAHAAARLFGPS